MIRQTLNILDQQRILSQLKAIPRLVVSNEGMGIRQEARIPAYPTIKQNYNYHLLHAEYENHCKQNIISNKISKEHSQLLETMQNTLLFKSISQNKLSPSNKVPSEMLQQTVVFNGISPTLNAEEDKTVFDLAGKRAKQAKKKRSKRKNGGHQSIRC